MIVDFSSAISESKLDAEVSRISTVAESGWGWKSMGLSISCIYSSTSKSIILNISSMDSSELSETSNIQ